MIQFPQEKIQEFFANHATPDKIKGRRIGQAFYDFMGYNPLELSHEDNVFLNRLYEMDGHKASQYIYMHSDYGQSVTDMEEIEK